MSESLRLAPAAAPHPDGWSGSRRRRYLDARVANSLLFVRGIRGASHVAELVVNLRIRAVYKPL